MEARPFAEMHLFVVSVANRFVPIQLVLTTGLKAADSRSLLSMKTLHSSWVGLNVVERRRKDASLSAELAAFALSVRMSRAQGFDWRAAYVQLEARIPVGDEAALHLFRALFADTENSANSRPVPAYHNALHTLDTLRAMEILCASAARLGFDTPAPHLLIIAMLGHDLRHPGGASTPLCNIEQMSADIVAGFAHESCMSDTATQLVINLILATRPAYQITMRMAGGGDMAEWLVGEADLLASLLPGVGLDLSEDLTREMAAVGQAVATPFESGPARLEFLRCYSSLSSPAKALGLADAMAMQILELEASTV